MHVAENLRRHRLKRELKQEVVAQVIGISQQTYSRYETGEYRIPGEYIELIAKFYGISVAEIYGEQPAKPTQDLLDAKHRELYEMVIDLQQTIIRLQGGTA